MDEVEPQWLSDYREQVLEARESEREDDLRELERIDEWDSVLWMIWLPPKERDDG